MLLISVTSLVIVLLLSINNHCTTSALDYEPVFGRDQLLAEKHQFQPDRPSDQTANGLGADGRSGHAIAAAAGFLLSRATDTHLNLSDPIDRHLSDILNRNGPDMRPSRDYKDFKDITLNVSMRAWSLLHQHAQFAISNRIDYTWPALREIMVSAKVSNKCQKAISATMDGARRMESWSIKMLNSWGTFPMSGLFEGTYGDVGAFHTCVGIKDNVYIDHAHYCSITFRPILPSTKDYELVLRKEPESLRLMFERDTKPNVVASDFSAVKLNSTNNEKVDRPHQRDAFTDLLNHAQYHHYVNYKWGTCWPIDCTPFDIKRVTRLLGRRNILSNGPVKCYSKNKDDYEQPDDIGFDNMPSTNGTNSSTTTKKLVISLWDKNDGIFIWKPQITRAHKVSLSIFIVVSVFILLMTLVDLIFNRLPYLGSKIKLAIRNLPSDDTFRYQPPRITLNDENGGAGSCLASRQVDFAVNQFDSNSRRTRIGFSVISTSERDYQNNNHSPEEDKPPLSTFMSVVDDCSIITNAPQFFRVSEGQMKNDILCLNGVRCFTMIWIIMTHTMMYNDWAAFARTREVERSLDDLMSQPFFNGSYLVDTFFLMSGLLSSLTAFKHCQGLRAKFNSFAYIMGRWLRLTPQIFFVSMIFIFFPILSSGPHWFPIVGEYSENCVNNWWINVFHLQAFYKKEEMCNFVTWWISIDFFYHFFALAIIWVIMLLGHRCGFLTITGIVLTGMTWQCINHYNMGLPPNVFSTIPQTGAMWTEMTLKFFWTPWTHVIPFFFGFYLGYLMALKKKLIVKNLNTRRSLIGWILSISLLVGQSYATYWWITGRADYSKLVSTTYYTICAFIWSASLCWIIVACQYGYGGVVNRVLSWKVFIILGKASYLVYLSHFMILFVYYANQSLLLEPTPIVMIYIIIGNILFSTLLGIVLCIVYELPWLKTHRRLMKYV